MLDNRAPSCGSYTLQSAHLTGRFGVASAGWPTLSLFGSLGPFTGGVALQMVNFEFITRAIYSKVVLGTFKSSAIVNFAQKKVSEIEIRCELLRGRSTKRKGAGFEAVLNWGKNEFWGAVGVRREYLKGRGWIDCEFKSDLSGMIEFGVRGGGSRSVSFVWSGIRNEIGKILPQLGFRIRLKE